MATIAITPASGDITATKSACRIDVTDAANLQPPNNTGGEFRYRLIATATGENDLVSPEFSPSSDGKYSWYNLIFPAAGSWTITLTDTEDESSEATLAVTVA